MLYYEHIWLAMACLTVVYYKTATGKFVGGSKTTTHYYPKSLVWC
jgi:hypothetical protein